MSVIIGMVIFQNRVHRPAPSTAAETDLLNLLRRRSFRLSDGGPAGVAHCFQGSAPAAWELIQQGFMIGVDGPLTYPNASALRALIGHLPLESLVLETDSPYLPPHSHRGKRNEPALLAEVVRALAELKHVAVEKIAAVTAANARRLYRLPFV
jgi:TatD DNase family protein